STLLLLGYSLGVAVMIVLLSIGEALLAQARDEKLVGGGSITVLPEGIDVEDDEDGRAWRHVLLDRPCTFHLSAVARRSATRAVRVERGAADRGQAALRADRRGPRA